MADWSQLPYDLISKIANQLCAIEDFLAFSGVCRSWRSVYTTKNWKGSQVPWLMLSDNQDTVTRGFFSLYKNKVYKLELPEARGRRCWGSNNGWLVTIGSDLEIHLLNPINRLRINLPPQPTFPLPTVLNPKAMITNWVRFIHKAIVIKKPNPQNASEADFLVMVIYGPNRHLAFARPGFDGWIIIDSPTYFGFRDVICFKGQIYAVRSKGTLVLVEIDGPGPPTATDIASPEHDWDWEQIFLVESLGDLLMVFRNESYAVKHFEVYKFDFNNREWTKLEELGDSVLFVGDSYSMSILASDVVNLQNNSIYFTGDNVERFWTYLEHYEGRDTGVYNMAVGTIANFSFGEDHPSYYSCPIWVIPTLY